MGEPTEQLTPGRNVVITTAGDRLMMNYPGNPFTIPMFAESRTRVFMTIGDGVLEFPTNAEGRIATLVIHSGVYPTRWRFGEHPDGRTGSQGVGNRAGTGVPRHTLRSHRRIEAGEVTTFRVVSTVGAGQGAASDAAERACLGRGGVRGSRCHQREDNADRCAE